MTLCHLAWVATAAAHPLGNFTINRFSRIEVSGHRLYVVYVLDMAEIPTFQAGRIDADGLRAPHRARSRVDRRRASRELVPGSTALAHPRGAGGLRTTRLEVVLRGPVLDGSSAIGYRDTNYADRIGWKEIVVGKDAPSRSNELRAYPKDLLQSPLDVTTAPRRSSRATARHAAGAARAARPSRLPTASPTPASRA